MALRRHCSSRRTVTGTTSKWAWPPNGGGGTAAASDGAGTGTPAGPWGGSLNALDQLDGPGSASETAWPQTEKELASRYHKAIMDQQQRHLEPLREDLADWLNKILGKCPAVRKSFFFTILLLANCQLQTGTKRVYFFASLFAIFFHHIFFPQLKKKGRVRVLFKNKTKITCVNVYFFKEGWNSRRKLVFRSL